MELNPGVFVYGALLFSTLVISSESKGTEPSNDVRVFERATVAIDLDAQMHYSDRLPLVMRRPSAIDFSAAALKSDANGVSSEQNHRTLGLKQLGLGLVWETPRRLRASVSIRPDATVTGELTRRELDTRSGPKFSEKPTIQLLDLYELTVIRSGVEFGVGVRDELLPSYLAYREVLGFGMEVSFVRKAFGFFVDIPEAAQLSHDGRFVLSAMALSHQDDRHLSKASNTATSDESPGKTSPYWGGGVSVRSEFGSSMALGIGFMLSEAKGMDGQSLRQFYSAGVKHRIIMDSLTTSIGLDVRQVKERYKMEGLVFANTSLTSSALTFATEVMPGRMVLVGARLGTGSRLNQEDTSQALTQRGLQSEFGLRAWLGDGLEATGLMTREWCRGQMESDGQSGCFGPVGSRSLALSRFAVQFNYQTGSTYR
jgi:hypothetical protein